MNGSDLKARLATTAFAFRGYNVTNLGRSRELLEHSTYGPIVERHLREASHICAEFTHRRVDLVERVRANRETTVFDFAEAMSLIPAMSLAQLQLLEQYFGVSYRSARVGFGYSLGEATAIVASGLLDAAEILRVPLSMSEDCVELAHDIIMGVVFSRATPLNLDQIKRQLVCINAEGRGVIGISALLSPNSLIVLGQGDTVDRLKEWLKESLPTVHLRKNDHRWPPLHTPIIWERYITDRSSVLLHTVQGPLVHPKPPILSLVTGKADYNDYNVRMMLRRWIDEPQRLWDVVYETLQMGIETIVHVGPDPNILPATYRRLTENVEEQMAARFHLRAISAAVSRPWLASLLPERAALFRAPFIQHVILEDWLLAQTVA